MLPFPETTLSITIVQKKYNLGTLYEVLYQTNSGSVFLLEVTNATLKEFAYIDEDAESEYDSEDGFIAYAYTVPDDLSDAEIFELIKMYHDEDDEPLYSKKEWAEKNKLADAVGYPFYFSFEIENYGHSLHTESYEDIVNGENQATAWARVSPFEEHKVQLARISYRGVDVLPFLTKVLKGDKHTEAIFNALEFKAQDIYQRLYE